MSCFAQAARAQPPVRGGARRRCACGCATGVDETFHVNRLKREITEFLSPWAFRGDARPTFNGTVYKSVLVNFVEERPYVDYVSDVRLFRQPPRRHRRRTRSRRRSPARARSRSSCPCRPTSTASSRSTPRRRPSLAEDCACAPAVPDGARAHSRPTCRLPAAEDFYRLRREGIGHIEKTGSDRLDRLQHPRPGHLDPRGARLRDHRARLPHRLPDRGHPRLRGAARRIARGARTPTRPSTRPAASSPSTRPPPTDFRRLLIDVDTVRNAWVRCKACACDAPSSPGARTTSSSSPTTRRSAPTRPPGVPVDPRGLYDVLLELEADPTLRRPERPQDRPAARGDRSDGPAPPAHRRGALPGVGPRPPRRTPSSWRPTRQAVHADRRRAEPHDDRHHPGRPTPSCAGTGSTCSTSTTRSRWPTARRSPSRTPRCGSSATARSRRQATVAGAARLARRRHRRRGSSSRTAGSCPSPTRPSTPPRRRSRRTATSTRTTATSSLVEIDEIAVCADVEVEPSADIELVQARIWYEIERYLDPPVEFWSLDELLARGEPVEAIFNGPELDNGFLTAARAPRHRPADRAARVRPPRPADRHRRRDQRRQPAAHRLRRERQPDRGDRRPGLDQRHARLRPRPDQRGVAAVPARPTTARGCTARSPGSCSPATGCRSCPASTRPRTPSCSCTGRPPARSSARTELDLPMPLGRTRALEAYYPVQHSFPLTYGIGPAGLPSTATAAAAGPGQAAQGAT